MSETNHTTSSYEPITNSPFVMVGKDGHYFIGFGKYKITEDAPSKEEALEELEKNKWNVITNIAIIIASEAMEKEVKNEQ